MSAFNLQLLDALGVKLAHLVTDSRQVKLGDTFVAYPGGATDGRQYIAQAIANGANAVLWEAKNFVWDESWAVPHLAIVELRHQAGAIADYVYGAPSKKLWMVGVTGTNGKTSCSHWIANSMTTIGRKSALIGTLGNGFSTALQATLNTTPDAIRVHGLLAEYVQQQAQAVAMEVSSHALSQGRINCVNFDVALLTNLSRDHLDYHGDMQNYATAKRRLFDWAHLKHAVLNLDDGFGVELAEALRDAEVEVVGYGMSEQALQLAERMGIRMVYGHDLHMDAHGIRCRLHTSWGAATLCSALVGRFNVANLLGSMAVLLVSGVELEMAVQALAQQKPVVGRMQTVGGVGQPTLVIDYAHTPDALEKVLQALREVVSAGGGKLICVFGCGGDRDRGKRPMMGKVASTLADRCIITSDNPRSESAQGIIDAILLGVESDDYVVIEDRAQAIAHAVATACVNDTVLIAGKGHEDYQEIGGVKHPFSDVSYALNNLAHWRSGRAA